MSVALPAKQRRQLSDPASPGPAEERSICEPEPMLAIVGRGPESPFSSLGTDAGTQMSTLQDGENLTRV